MALVIRDPENFHSKPYSVPRISDLRLFVAGSESTELTERCLETGRILVSNPTLLLTFVLTDLSKPTPSLLLPSGP